MRIQSEEQRRAAEGTLKEVMSKLEEALKLAREMESHDRQDDRQCTCTGAHA